MTRFEEACESLVYMAVAISFCIAAYLEKINYIKFEDDELRHFMDVTADDIEKWLLEESEISGKEQE